jgi:hypothetical protein
LLAILGAAGIFSGLALAERIHALLPEEITADAAAVGGAALALGAALVAAGAVHVAAAVAVAHGRGLVPVAVLCLVMAVLAVGWAIAAAVSAAAGNAPAGPMLLATGGLLLVGVAYGWAATLLLALRRPAGSSI